jgi:hypothetical protein
MKTCWKKTRNDEIREVWINKKTKRIVAVEDDENTPTKLKSVFHSGLENDYIDKTKYFKNKSQTLKFANKYMKSHGC